ncbi:MAG: hypothetical protein M1582_01610 [Actinobacteria bacterium]|nr:hypothetical protein [Actinomycetota bacterium]
MSETTSTSLLFTATKHHFDPSGSTIRFTIYERGREIYLQQKARALQESWTDVYKYWLFPTAAFSTRAQIADNLRRAVDPACMPVVPGL